MDTDSKYTVSNSVKTRILPAQEVIERILEDSTKSPSGDNAQPWKFQWDGESLFVFHVESLAKHSLNRKNNASRIAFGTLIEAMKISASNFGFDLKIDLSLHSQGHLAQWAKIDFFSGAEVSPLYPIISARTTDRRAYKGGKVSAGIRAQLKALENEFAGCRIHIQETQSKSFMKYFLKTEELLWKNKSIVSDLTKWMRLSKSEQQKSQDGMSWRNMGMNIIEAFIFKAIRRFSFIPSILWSLGFGAKISKMGQTAIDSSAALICFSVDELNPESHYLIGRMAYKAWLILNANGFGVQPLSFQFSTIADMVSGDLLTNSAIEIENFQNGKEVIRENFGLAAYEVPVWAFRTGLSAPLPAENRTQRRAIKLALISARVDPRFSHSIALNFVDGLKMKTEDVSKGGFKIIMDSAVIPGDSIIELSAEFENDLISLRVQPVWKRVKGLEVHRGFQILSPPQRWIEMIDQVKAQNDSLNSGQSL